MHYLHLKEETETSDVEEKPWLFLTKLPGGGLLARATTERSAMSTLTASVTCTRATTNKPLLDQDHQDQNVGPGAEAQLKAQALDVG